MCCGIYCLIASRLLEGRHAKKAVEEAARLAGEHYRGAPWDGERAKLQRVLSLDIAGLSRSEVRASAYVVHTLEASVWVLLNTGSLREALLTAVNLGDDTDTAGCITGGLAGALYGRAAIPTEWIEVLARRDDILALCARFLRAVQARRGD
jgi:ADP-ribosylglycohydrolase